MAANPSTPVFSFGHPCEHQLRRTCIGGINCPLNGYPDTWCCSFVKGKINFKRDKPCEGPRCRWGFVHPPQQSFDTVTQLIADARALSARFEEVTASGEGGLPTSSERGEVLNFQLDQQHVVDAVHCTMHFLRIPAPSCGRLVGQMFAWAAVKTHDPKVFTMLLRTMKKPVDVYLIGAFELVEQQLQQREASRAKQEESGKKAKKKAQDDVLDDLRSDIVEIMNSALSSGGQLVDREEQRPLQYIFIAALNSFPKGRKKAQEMLEKALSRFSHPILDAPDQARKTVAARVSSGSDIALSEVAAPPKEAAGTQGPKAAAGPPAAVVPSAPSPAGVSSATAAVAAPRTHSAAGSTSSRGSADAVAPTPPSQTLSDRNSKAASQSVAQQPQAKKSETTTTAAGRPRPPPAAGEAPDPISVSPLQASVTPTAAVPPLAPLPAASEASATPHAGSVSSGAKPSRSMAPAPADVSPTTHDAPPMGDSFTLSSTPPNSSSSFMSGQNGSAPAPASTVSTTPPSTPSLPPVPTAKAGLSRLELSARQTIPPYYPIISGSDMPDICIIGGLFGLGPRSSKAAPLGSVFQPSSPPASKSPGAGALPMPAAPAVGVSSPWHLDPVASAGLLGSASSRRPVTGVVGAVGTPPTAGIQANAFPSYPLFGSSGPGGASAAPASRSSGLLSDTVSAASTSGGGSTYSPLFGMDMFGAGPSRSVPGYNPAGAVHTTTVGAGAAEVPSNLLDVFRNWQN